MLIIRSILGVIILFSFITKIITPNIFISFVISIFKNFGINYIFVYINYKLIGFVFLVPILIFEFLIVYYCIYDKKKFSYVITIFTTGSLLISLFMYIYNINYNCGCVGDMFHLSNVQHLYLTSILFIFSTIYLFFIKI